MGDTPRHPLYCCLSTITIGDKPVDLGHGVALLPEYAHVMSHTMLAIRRPDKPDHAHPGPWAATGDGFGFDSDVVLYVPATYARHDARPEEIARRITALLRLWVDPRIRLTLMSTQPPGAIAAPMSGPRVHVATAVEVQQWYYELSPAIERDTLSDLRWVQEHWETALDLTESSAAFRLGLEAIANAQVIHSSALGLVSAWAALEALFTSSTTELRFRVSALIAAFLNPPGAKRAAEHKRVLKLYDARSAAAHGAPKHSRDDLLASLELLRKVLIKMVHDKKVPTREELESLLFGDK